MSQSSLHPAQITILKALLFVPEASFSSMTQQTGLTSDHCNFHVKTLLQHSYLTKSKSGQYRLTPSGKEFANQLDTDTDTFEKQPKIAVLLNIQRQTDHGIEILVQQRLKQPFYGFWGRPSGKVRWGETILETAARELKEETNLVCDNLKFYGLYHKIDFNQDSGELLEDKLFCQVLCQNPTGQLAETFPGGVNKFVTYKELDLLDKKFEGLDQPFKDGINPELRFEEQYHYYQPDEY